MEAQTPLSPHSQAAASAPHEFAVGETVMYPHHGRCTVAAIETRQLGSEEVRLYRLEVQKSNLSRSQKQEPAIWIPVQSAVQRGLRAPLSADAAKEVVMKLLLNREYYFSVHEPWAAIYPKLEQCIRDEGAAGLAKVASYLFVLGRYQVVPAVEVNRFNENVLKLLQRELSQALQEPISEVETRIKKAFRQKSQPDN